MDQTQNLDNFFDFIWNVLTAQGYGLDTWGRIVGVTRNLLVPGSSTFLGFQESGNDWTGFGQGGLYGGQAVTDNVTLIDAQFRPLVLAKAASNVCDGSIHAINSILLALFAGRGQAYVADNQNMSLTYTFSFPLTALDTAVVRTSGVLPNPAGVVVNISAP